MKSYTLIIAVASGVVLALAGCATNSTMGWSGGPVKLDCTNKKNCDVTAIHRVWWAPFDIPEVIDVKVAPTDTVTIKWTIDAYADVTFSGDGGINFKGGSDKRIFDCKIDGKDSHVFTCTGKGLAPNTDYKYGIKSKGFFSPADIDPIVRNGS